MLFNFLLGPYEKRLITEHPLNSGLYDMKKEFRACLLNTAQDQQFVKKQELIRILRGG